MTMADDMTLGRMENVRQNLKKLRRMQTPPLTQKRLAEKLGYSRGTYASYETGRRRFSAEFLLDAADYFGISVETLCDREMSAGRYRKE